MTSELTAPGKNAGDAPATDNGTAHPLRDSDAFLRSILRAIPALIVTCTPDGAIEEIDDHYSAYTGLTLEQAKDWEHHQVIHPDDVERAMAVWTHALATCEPMQNEMRLRAADGTYRWHLVEGTPMRDAAGNVLRWVTVNIDIDERKRAEEHERYLAETTARLVAPVDSEDLLKEIARLAVPALSDICAIGLFDSTERTVRVETAGADARELPHVAAIHLRSWRAYPGASESVGDLINSGRAVFMQDVDEAWLRAVAGSDDQVEAALAVNGRSIICVPLLARGETIGMATFATTRSRRRYTESDVRLLREVAARLSIAIENLRLFEDLRRSAAELQRANAAKDEFFSLVSHELKTPITTILGNAEILDTRRGMLSDENTYAAVSDIRNESKRLQRIVDNLLNLARLEGRSQIELEPVIVRRVVRRVVDDYQLRFPERPIRFTAPKETVPALAAPLGIEQIIVNMLSNAEKYSPAGETIDVTLETTPDEIVVTVRDHGIGFEPEEAERLFEPFYRSASSRGIDGIGIGLAVCRRLVEVQGGRIWARTQPAGGAEFGFALPRAYES